MADPLLLASTKALAIPEILCLIFDCMTLSALRQASLVCKEWERLANIILANQLVIPDDWYVHDLTHLWPYLDRRGEFVKALSLELSEATRLVPEVDLERVTQQLDNILSRTPNLERLEVQVPREVKSSILTTVIGKYGKKLHQFDTNLLNWEPSDMAHLLEDCSQIRHLSGHNFTGDLLQAIARTQPLLSKIDCTHPRFDDDELIAFAKHFPNLLRLSVSVHQFMTAKALIGVADYCFQLEYLNFHFCLSLQSNGFQALLAASPNLRFLDLGLTEVRDADIVLVASRCPQLESLKLPFCGNLTQMSIRAIVRSCTRLVHLDLSFCDKIMLTIFGDPSSPSTSSTSSPSSSASTPYSPWACLGLQYLDISGIHASYSADASVASALLPAMYRQLGLLIDLRTLKLSGHGFSLKILEQGRTGLSKLTKLERLDIAKLRNPLPWATIIEIGNLFPRLTELQFRSNDVIPPQATLAQEQAIEEVEARVGHRIKRGKFVDQQPEPLYQDDEDDGGQAGSTSLPVVVPTGSGSSSSRMTTTSSSTGTTSTPSESSLSRRKRSRSPSPTPSTPSTAAEDIIAAGRSSEQDAKKRTSLRKAAVAAMKQKQPEIMSATLRSGLEISFRLNGEDEDDSHGGPGDIGTGGGIVGWGFPEAMPY